jgi:hypothetical protein
MWECCENAHWCSIVMSNDVSGLQHLRCDRYFVTICKHAIEECYMYRRVLPIEQRLLGRLSCIPLFLRNTQGRSEDSVV